MNKIRKGYKVFINTGKDKGKNGIVSSILDNDKVLVERRVKHPVVGKVIKLSSKFHAHDEKNSIGEGDLVEIAESKPMSKTKTWVVTKVLSKAPQIN